MPATNTTYGSPGQQADEAGRRDYLLDFTKPIQYLMLGYFKGSLTMEFII